MKPNNFQPNSLAGRLVKFFADNPGEELTYEDLCVKFDVTIGNVRQTLTRLIAMNLVYRESVVRAVRPPVKAPIPFSTPDEKPEEC